jgi:hypothetical protein
MSGIVRREWSRKRKNRAMRPALEGLEARLVLSTFKVNTTLDSVAVDLKTGRDATGRISLRSAVQAANSNPNGDTIVLPSGTFTLTIKGANEDNAATGDLDRLSRLPASGKALNSPKARISLLPTPQARAWVVAAATPGQPLSEPAARRTAHPATRFRALPERAETTARELAEGLICSPAARS